MLQRHLETADSHLQTVWQELGEGAPTIIGFANLCSLSMSQPIPPADQLPPESLAILAAAAERGMMDIRASKVSNFSSERLLAVCIEVDEDRRLHFLFRDNPELTIRFLNGFRVLCQHGLIMHHLERDFSLTVNGFEIARQLDREEHQGLIDLADEIPF